MTLNKEDLFETVPRLRLHERVVVHVITIDWIVFDCLFSWSFQNFDN